MSFRLTQIFLLFSLVISAGGCGQNSGERAANNPAATVAVEMVDYQSESILSFTTYGRIDPPRQASIVSPVNLPLKVIRQVGDKVKQGEILIQFETAVLQQQKANLQNAMSQMNASPERDKIVAQIDELNRQINTSTIFAPYDVVVSKSTTPRANPIDLGTEVMRVVEEGSLRISTRVPIWVKDKLATETGFWIYIDDELSACTVEDDPNESDAYASRRLFLSRKDVEISPESKNYFRSVRIRFGFPQSTAGFWIPTTALIDDGDGKWSLYAVETIVSAEVSRQIATRKRISVLGFEGARAFVEGPLDQGATIIIRGTQKIVSGQEVLVSATENAEQTDRLAENE